MLQQQATKQIEMFNKRVNDATKYEERSIYMMTDEAVALQEVIENMRQTLLAFAAAALRPGSLYDLYTGTLLHTETSISLPITVAVYNAAIDLTSTDVLEIA